MRVVEDELRVAKFLRREINDASRLFEQLIAQLEGIENVLVDEAKRSAAENFDEEDVDDVVRIAGRRLSGEPSDDVERHAFLGRIDALAGGDAFARIQALLGRKRNPSQAAITVEKETSTSAPVARVEDARPQPESKDQSPKNETASAVPDGAASGGAGPDQGEEARQGRDVRAEDSTPRERLQPERSAERPAGDQAAGEHARVRRQTAVNGVEVPRRREVEVSGVAVPLSRQEKAVAIQAAAQLDAETTGRMNPPNGAKTSWQVRIYENAFRTRLREKHAGEAGADAALTGQEPSEGAAGERASQPEVDPPVALQTDVVPTDEQEVAEAPDADVGGTMAHAQSDNSEGIDAPFDHDDEPPLDTDEDRYPRDRVVSPYDVNDNSIGLDEDEGDDTLVDDNFPEPGDEQLAVAAPDAPSLSPPTQPSAKEPGSPPVAARIEQPPASDARAMLPVSPPTTTPRPPAVRAPTALPAQSRPEVPSQQVPVQPPATSLRPPMRPPSPPAAQTAPRAPEDRPAASSAPPLASSPTMAGQRGLMPRSRPGFLPTVTPGRRSAFDDTADAETLVKEAVVATAPPQAEQPERRPIRRPSVLQRIKRDDPPD
jgi:hypothetical protein